MAKTFRVGFIGAGAIALHHMKYLKAMAGEGVEIAAASDVSQKSLDRAKSEYGIPRLFLDFKQMLKEGKDLDAIDVCTPNALHAQNAIAALEAGKHVLVEKPMAMNVKEAKQMIDAAKRNKRELVIGFQYRFASNTKVVRDQIVSGAFGKILYVRCQALRRRGIPNWGVFGRKELQGGGPMIDIGVHILEVAHYMIGSPNPVTATGNTWTFHGNKKSDVASSWPNWDHKTYTVEDMAAGMIRFDNGVMLTVEASFVAHIEKDVWNIQIMGEKGGAVWDPPVIFKDQDGYMMNLQPGFVPSWDAFEQKMRHFVEVCRGERTNDSPGDAGLAVQKMLDGVYASAQKQREVAID